MQDEPYEPYAEILYLRITLNAGKQRKLTCWCQTQVEIKHGVCLISFYETLHRLISRSRLQNHETKN